jgi:putative ABC transport system substrate-binding protein
VTGVYPIQAGVKSLEFLREAIPGLSKVAVLWNPALWTEAAVKKIIEDGGRQVNVQIQFIDVRGPEDFAAAITLAIRQRAGALYVPTLPVTFTHRAQIGALAAKRHLPAAASFVEFAHAGGLIGYATNWSELWRHAATYADKILKGAKPGDLPVEQPTKSELLINLKTAKALGLTIPQSLLLRADEIIQ